jgi:hypothetical protein
VAIVRVLHVADADADATLTDAGSPEDAVTIDTTLATRVPCAI